jgi:hypothetical protein
MNRRSAHKWLIILLLMASAVWVPDSSRAEDTDSSPSRAAELMLDVMQSAQRASQNGGSIAIAGQLASAAARSDKNLSESIRKAAAAVRDANGDDAKSDAAKKHLAELLDKSFESDMVQREKELRSIEARLLKQRELVNRRHEKKQEIIELQMKVALNEAAGLGFYDSVPSEKTGKFGTTSHFSSSSGLSKLPAFPAPAADAASDE